MKESAADEFNRFKPADVFFTRLANDFGSLLFDANDIDRVTRVSDSDFDETLNHDTESRATLGVSATSVSATGVIAADSSSVSDGGALSVQTNSTASMTMAASITDSPLALVDANGQSVNVVLDENTLVIGAATWCSACAAFKEALAAPRVAEELSGLKLVFAFSDEGGAGLGGVENEAFLANLPGQVAFLAAGSVRPESFPSAFNSLSGEFDQSAFDAVGNWLAGGGTTPSAQTSSAKPQAAGIGLVDAGGGALDLTLDANTLVIGAGTWCGATQKLVATLQDPNVAAELDGLRIVFAFDNEGGDGPGGVLHGEFLDDLPGEVAFLAAGSVRPERLPMAYNPETGVFDQTAVAAINAWVQRDAAVGELVSGGTCGNKNVAVVEETEVAAAKPQAAGGDLPPAAIYDVPADFDANGEIDQLDLVIWQENYGLGVGADQSQGDADADGDVDGRDFLIWQRTFGDTIYDFTITAPLEPYNTSTPTIEWSQSFGAVSYDVTVATDPELTSIVATYPGVVGLSVVVGPVASGTYYVSVLAHHEDNPAVDILPAKNNGLPLVVDAPIQYQHTVFVTATTYSVNPNAEPNPGISNFGGHESADLQCTRRANAAGMTPGWDGSTRIYRALISTDTVNANSTERILIQGQIVNTQGELLAADSVEFWSGQIQTPIQYNEFGQPLPANTPFWTGSNQNGALSQNCVNWSQLVSQVANVGSSSVTNFWFNQAQLGCSQARRLLCIGPAEILE